jgi:hypothetical protein
VKKVLALVIFTAFFVVIASTKAAEPWQEPEDFRGLKWGASVQEMQKFYPKAMEMPGMFEGKRIKQFSVFNQEVGSVKTSFVLGFLDDRFSFASIDFKSSDFPILREAFVTRYGPAHSTREEKLQNRMGTEFTNHVLSWRGPTLSIYVAKYSGKVTDGTARIAKHDYAEELIRAYKQKGKDAAKGL